MSKALKKIIFKTLKITSITIGSILLLLFLLPVLFPGTIAEKVKDYANKHLDGEMNFSKVRLSFFSHFPSLTVSLYDYTLKGSAPFKNDTLVAADEIAFGINVSNLVFNKKVHIDKIFLDDALMNVQVNENGEANYNVYKSSPNSTTAANDGSGTAMRLEKIIISNSHLVYNDRSLPMRIEARGFNYTGNGDLNKSIFDLNSRMNIDSLDFIFSGETYLKNKRLDAELVTQVNTNSLAFVFTQNKLRINKLPVEFTGKLDFLKNGYDLDFTVTSTGSELADCVTALPPAYTDWQQQVKLKGKTDMMLTLRGAYVASTQQMPDLQLQVKIRDGYIQHTSSPVPLSNLFLNMDAALPAVNPDSLRLTVDSLFFNVDSDYLSAVAQVTGTNNPKIKGRVDAAIDLAQLDKALAIPVVDLKGKCQLHLTTNGQYYYGPDPDHIRQKQSLRSIPSFGIAAQLKDGYVKYDSLPQAISNINFNARIACPDHDYKNTSISIRDFSASILNNYVKGFAIINNIRNMGIDAKLQTNVNLAEISKAYPLDKTTLSGLMKLDIACKGDYNPAAGKFPLTTADINIQEAAIRTGYYPSPINHINVTAKAINSTGTLQSQTLVINKAAFQFEEKPFSLEAAFNNFEDILYDVKAKGELDIGRIYKVFSQQGLDVKGYVNADLHLSGRQSDALNKRYSKLSNEGTLLLRDIATTTVYLPLPFVIKEGYFRFKQDKMWFSNFSAQYGETDMQMNGYLQNLPAYILSDNAVLKGNFSLASRNFNVDEWMVWGNKTKADSSVQKKSTTPTGVVIIPSNLDLAVTAGAESVSFNNVNLHRLKGTLALSNGTLSLKDAGFKLLESETVLNAIYRSENTKLAAFDFNIKASDFDVKKAYDSVKLFRDMATAAAKAQGIISLEYAVKGKLDENMQPLYPSLEGHGVLSVKKVKVKGFRLFNAVSKSTGKDSIANPDVSKVDIRSSIKNNVITIDRFKIKMAGFRLRMEGQTSFDGRIKLKMRLGLPPLGIIGIPMNVSGTQDNPKIKLGKGDQEPLSETEYKEEGADASSKQPVPH